MGTVIRAELSKKNPYWIDKHRYYELKHFCMQYPLWKKTYVSLGYINSHRNSIELSRSPNYVSNPTEKISILRASLMEKIKMVENAAVETDRELAQYIIYGVTEGISYDTIRVRYNIPCCKDMYYENYRKFFWVLSKYRD